MVYLDHLEDQALGLPKIQDMYFLEYVLILQPLSKITNTLKLTIMMIIKRMFRLVHLLKLNLTKINEF